MNSSLDRLAYVNGFDRSSTESKEVENEISSIFTQELCLTVNMDESVSSINCLQCLVKMLLFRLQSWLFSMREFIHIDTSQDIQDFFLIFVVLVVHIIRMSMLMSSFCSDGFDHLLQVFISILLAFVQQLDVLDELARLGHDMWLTTIERLLPSLIQVT